MHVPSPSAVLHPAELGCHLLPWELPPGLCLSNKDGTGVFLQDQNTTLGMLCNGRLPLDRSRVDDGLVESPDAALICAQKPEEKQANGLGWHRAPRAGQSRWGRAALPLPLPWMR